MSTVDYVILGSYLLFLMGMGPVFQSFSRSASDFFRAGGTMIWWVAGSAVVMGGFSAWSFTGGAAKAYETGFFFLVLFACNLVATIVQYPLAAKFRQMRVVTAVEAIRKRFGPVNEQVFTWLPMPLGIFFAGMGLYTLCVFVSSAFPLDMTTLIVVVGVVVTVMGVAGGAWAVNASQFVQGLIFMTITLVMVYTTLTHEKVGGLSGLMAQLPASHLDWTEFARPGVLIAFILTLLLNQLIQMNAIHTGAQKFITVKNGRDAKRVVIMALVAMLVMTPIWMIPALGSVIVHPNLAGDYPGLSNPNEAAYVAMAQTTLPPGLLGLLICAIFSASLDNLSSGITVASAVLVRNFYIRVVDPAASDRRQILIGRVLSATCGGIMIVVALGFSQLKSLPLYDLLLIVAASVGLPQAVPLFLGLFVRRAPSWSLWSTLAVGFATAIALRFVLTPSFIQGLWGAEPALSPRELGDLNIAITTGVLLVVCTAWFLGAAWLGRPSPADEARTAAFFAEMNTPLTVEEQHVGAYESDDKQYRTLAMLSLVYGGFILLLVAVPNTPSGRVGLAFCGGTIAAAGAVLWSVARWKSRAAMRGQGHAPPLTPSLAAAVEA